MTSGGISNTNPTHSTSSSSGSSIPIWVSGQQVWVRGIDKKTTINDIVVAFVGKSDQENYNIVEKYKNKNTHQKPLDPETKIYKLCKAWNSNAQEDIKLTLEKKSNIDDDSGRGSPSSTTTTTTVTSCRRRHHRNKNKYKNNQNHSGGVTSGGGGVTSYIPNSQTLHPKRLEQISKKHNVEKQSIENLLKLILIQEETIQSQIEKLQDRNKKIEQLEQLKYKNHTNKLGSNYVINTYLNSIQDDPILNQTPLDQTKNNSNNSNSQKNKKSKQISRDESGKNITKDINANENEDNGSDDNLDNLQHTLEEEVEFELDDLKKKIELFENIIELNNQITHYEEQIVHLSKATETIPNQLQSNTSETKEIINEIQCIQNQIDTLSISNENYFTELNSSNIVLDEKSSQLISKQKYLSWIESQFQNECIIESEYLQFMMQNMTTPMQSQMTSMTETERKSINQVDESRDKPLVVQTMGVLDTLV